MSLEVWSNRPEAISAMRKLLASQLMQDALGVLYAQMPIALTSKDEKVTETQSSIQLGRIQGYLHCLEMFTVLAQFPSMPPEPIESEFEYEEYLKRERILTPEPN